MNPRSSFFAAAGAAVLLLCVAGCGDRSTDTMAPIVDAVADATTSTSGGKAEAKTLPNLGAAVAWKLKTPDGRELSSANFGGKVQVLNFWATWCPPCVAEIPDLKAAQSSLGKRGVVIVGISTDRGAGVVTPFVSRMGINYPITMDDGELSAAYTVEYLPTTLVIDREGRVRARHVGPITESELTALVTPLL